MQLYKVTPFLSHLQVVLWYLLSSVLPFLRSNAPLVTDISNPMASIHLVFVRHWWRDSGIDLSSLTHSSRRINLFSNFCRTRRLHELRTDGNPIAWRAWSTAQNQLWQLRQPAPPLEFPGEQGMFIDMYAQVREEEQVISPQFTRNQQDVSMRRRKKRKQVEDGALIV